MMVCWLKLHKRKLHDSAGILHEWNSVLACILNTAFETLHFKHTNSFFERIKGCQNGLYCFATRLHHSKIGLLFSFFFLINFLFMRGPWPATGIIFFSQQESRSRDNLFASLYAALQQEMNCFGDTGLYPGCWARLHVEQILWMSIDRAGQNVSERDANLQLGLLFIAFSIVGLLLMNISDGRHFPYKQM